MRNCRQDYCYQHTMTHTISRHVALGFRQVGSKNGIVQSIKVDRKRMVTFVVEPDLITQLKTIMWSLYHRCHRHHHHSSVYESKIHEKLKLTFLLQQFSVGNIIIISSHNIRRHQLHTVLQKCAEK